MKNVVPLFAPLPGQTTVLLSRCRWWQKDDSGHVTKVRCPDHDHCLRMVELVDGRIGPHESNIENIVGRCTWIGMRVVDDR